MLNGKAKSGSSMFNTTRRAAACSDSTSSVTCSEINGAWALSSITSHVRLMTESVRVINGETCRKKVCAEQQGSCVNSTVGATTSPSRFVNRSGGDEAKVIRRPAACSDVVGGESCTMSGSPCSSKRLRKSC